MKKTKIFYGNQYIGSARITGEKFTKVQLFTNKVKNIIKKSLIGLGFISVVGWSFVAGAYFMPRTVVNNVTVAVKDSTLSPVMQRIETCESSKHQLNKEGQVLVHVNKDGSYDIGIFEINSKWNATATKMGFDLTKQSDNEQFAQWIYETRGTEDWYSSKSCWE
jgi:hypothetical protein